MKTSFELRSLYKLRESMENKPKEIIDPRKKKIVSGLKSAPNNIFTPLGSCLIIDDSSGFKNTAEDYMRAITRINSMHSNYLRSIDVLIWDAYPKSNSDREEFMRYIRSHGYTVNQVQTSYINCFALVVEY